MFESSKEVNMKKVLIVVDYQNDFVAQDGALSISGASSIASDIQKLITNPIYENVIYTFDTHIPIEYSSSDEAKMFPNIHCEFGKPGWELFEIRPRHVEEFERVKNALDEPFSMIVINEEFFFTKNVFDIWQGNSEYSEWFLKTFDPAEFEFDVVGVAYEVCVYQNIMGMVEKGYKVNFIESCSAAITEQGKETAKSDFIQSNVIIIPEV